MEKRISPSGLPAGIVKLSEIDLAELGGKNTAIARLLETREVRRALANILPDMLNLLTGDSRFKKFIMKLVGKYVNRSLSRPEDIFEKNELQSLFNDGQFIRRLAEPMPDIINGLFDILVTLTKTIEKMPAAEKKDVFGDVISKIATGQTGEIITRSCRIINDIHKDDPEFFAKNLAPGFQKWIESVDFAELKEMTENSATDVRAFVIMANSVMWQYPTKVVLLFSLLPTIVNMLSDALDISVGCLNDLPPDLLTDVVLSLLNEIDARPITGLINELTELVRKIHTGSALLGEPGIPQLPNVLSKKIEEFYDQADPVILWKAKIALAETKATLGVSIAEAENARPNFKHLSMIKRPEISNIRIKALNQKLAAWEYVDDEDLAKSMTQHLAAYDIQELAEVVNNTLQIINRLGDENQDILSGLVAQFADAVDDYELSEAAKKIFNAGNAIQPLARSVVPGLVTWICNVIQPADDAYEDDAEQARKALASLFVKEEV